MSKTEKTQLPLIAKVCIFLAGFTNIFLGYAIYFVMYDTDEEKAKYFRVGARTGIICFFLIFIVSFVLAFFGIDIWPE